MYLKYYLFAIFLGYYYYYQIIRKYQFDYRKKNNKGEDSYLPFNLLHCNSFTKKVLSPISFISFILIFLLKYYAA